MKWVPNVFRRRGLYDDLAEEIRLHIEERAEQLVGEGMAPEAAAREARRAFGNRTLIEERSREVWQWPTAESIRGDARLAWRQLRRSPGFAFAAVGTMALAIGANAVVFSVMNAFLLRPLDAPQPESLYQLQRGDEKIGQISYPNYLDLRDRNRSFDELAAYGVLELGFDSGKNPVSAWALETSGNYFDALRLRPYLGRFFHASDEHGDDSAPYVVLFHSFWHTHFQDDRGVIGRVVRLNGQPFTVIGVAPPEFHGTLMFFNPAFLVPIVEHPLLAGPELTERGTRFLFQTLGHLKPGVTTAQAESDLDATGAYLQATYPKDNAKMTFVLRRPNLYGDFLGDPVRAFLAGLMLLTGLILLAACANLGSLFAARAADRSREVALRLALGSSRRRILRGLFTEALMISVAGGAVGLAGSIALLRALSVWEPIPNFPIHLAVNPDAKVYAVAALLALASGLLFGAVPVGQVLRTNPYEVVKGGASARRGGRISVREALLVAQIAICAVLVTSSLVAARGLFRSLHAPFGFEIENTTVAETDLGMSGYSGDRVPALQRRMIEALQALPGVESVGLTDALPLSPNGGSSTSVFSDRTVDLRPANAAGHPVAFDVSPEYFRAAGTALLSGRTFTWHDDKTSTRVAVVNREFARKIFGSAAAALGGWFKLKDGTRIQVVGIAEDGKYGSLTEDPKLAMFLPILQWPATSTVLVARSRSGFATQAIGEAMRKALRRLDAGLPILIETRSKPLESTLFGPRIATITLGVLGIMGAMLSITGIFGMAAYSVSKRLKELGIRVALGARRQEVLRTALGRSFRMLAIGSGAGLVLGLMATKVLAFLVYEATPRDPLVLGGVVAAMALLGLAATWIPAQRALSVDPMVLLRED